MTKPYTEEIFLQEGTNRKYIIRKFDTNVEDDELVWHTDKQNRTVTVLQGINWQLQMDDTLPKELEVGKQYFITKGKYHRLIKGKNNLVVRIENI
jgi:hypothetical protein